MNSKDADNKYGKQVIATQLIDLTNSVVENALYVLHDFYPYGITEQVCNLLDKEENKDIFYDKIFNAVQECFTLPQIKILNKSNEDSGNYHLMYKKLHEHFKEKIAEAGENESSIQYDIPIIQQIDDDEIYLILFKEMRDMIPEPCNKNTNMWREVPKSREVDYGKIQERFSK